MLKNRWILATTWCLALIGARTTPALAQGLELRLAGGYDNNVFEVSQAASAAPVQAYYGHLAIAYEPEARARGFSFSLWPQGYVTWYPQAVSGNQYGGRARLRFKYEWRNPRRRPQWFRRTTSYLDVSGGYERSIYPNRARDELGAGTVDEDIPVTELPGRAFAEAELGIHSSVTKTVTIEAGATSAFTDYSDAVNVSLPSLSRLNSRQVAAFFEASVDIVRGWAVSGKAAGRHRVYINREARTADGTEVPGETRRLWYLDLEGDVRFRSAAVRNVTAIRYRRRSDPFEGYYSYNLWRVTDRLAVWLSPRLNLALRYSYWQKQHDRFAASGSRAPDRYHDARAQLAAALARAWQVALGWDYERTVSDDPLRDYSRMKLFAEISTRL